MCSPLYKATTTFSPAGAIPRALTVRSHEHLLSVKQSFKVWVWMGSYVSIPFSVWDIFTFQKFAVLRSVWAAFGWSLTLSYGQATESKAMAPTVGSLSSGTLFRGCNDAVSHPPAAVRVRDLQSVRPHSPIGPPGLPVSLNALGRCRDFAW